MLIPSLLPIRALRSLAMLSCCALPGQAVLAARQVIECPAAILPASIHIVDAAAGWKSHVPAPLYLHAAAPSDGPPEKLGELADFTTHPGKTEWSYTYSLQGSFPDGKWMQCAYGTMNEITLSKKIDDSVTECKLTYRKGKRDGVPRRGV